MSAARGRCQPNRCAATAALSGHSHQHQGGGGQQITVGVGTGPVVRIGAVRVRLSPAPVAQPGGDCCCIPRSRIPLPATTTSVATATAANNRRGIFSRGAGPAPVYRSTLEWRQRAPNVVTGCFGRDKTSGGSEEDARQLIETDTLDRLLKSRFGGDRGGRGKRPAPHKKKPRSSDKTERLRELTEKLKSPPGRAEAGPSTGARVSGGGQPEPAPKPKSPAVQPQPPPPTATDDDFETNLKLPKAESRTIVGSYIQRTIPFRSASFSQVDFSPSDGKYIRIGRTPSTSKIPSLGNSSMCLSLPRKKNADSSPSSASVASSTTVIDASGSSNPSINSAPGSSEWVFPKGNSKAVEAHVKSPSLRSLTHPLGRRSTSEEANSFSTVEGTGLWTVGSGERQLEGLREESDTDVMSTGPELTETDNQNQGNSLSPEKEAGCVESSQTSGQQGQSPLLILGKNIDSINNNVESVVENVTNLCVSDDIGEYKLGIDSDTIGSQELENSSHLDNPNLTQPLPTPPVQTFVTKWPEETVTSGECQSGVSDLIDPKEVVLRSHSGSDEGKDEHKINKVQSQKCRGGVMKSFIECTVIPPNMSEEDMRKRWSDDVNSGDRTSNEWGSSAQEEPQSPEDGGIRLNWPRVIDRPDKKWLERPRLVCQSSEEKDDDSMRGSPRRFHPLGRNDSLSEGESDPGRPMTPTRDGTASPSILGPSDQSDSESRFGSSMSVSRSPNTTRRYSKRPLRGPYGQMLEAEMKKPEANRKFSKLPNEDLKFLENYTQPPTSPVKPARTRAVDDCHLRRSFTSPEAPLLSSIPRSSPKRKVSANIPFSAPNPLTLADDLPPIAHIRTTSSPSQLEGCATAAVTRTSANSRPPPPQPSPQLLAQLLKGSSERALGQDTHSLPLHHWKDTRTHVVAELYETERSYVESLQTLVTKYLEPLKSPDNAGLVEAALVDEIFYQVPAILTYHEEFLEALKNRIYNWNVKQGVGDIFLETFSKQAVIDTYAAFINNWKTAKEAIKTTCQAKPAFARFLEAMAREHKGKLALDSLLIMPVQRIPRYELLIQTLLKHTETSHPDHGPLCAAQREVHALAVRINCTERDSLELEQLEGLIEGAHLVAAERSFLRHDLVTVASGQGRKERALFLFSDLLVVTSIKRRSGTIRKPSMNCPGTIASTLEANKYKMLMRIPLDDLEIVKEKDENVRRMLREMEHLREDVCALAQMSELAGSLHCPHSQLEADVREMHAALSKQLAERQASDSQLSYLELMLNTQNGVDNLSVIFSKPDKRSSWEEALIEAKQRLALSADKRLCPELVTPVPIRKTRAGLQLTCAAPTLGAHDVWVCNSDGYVGQVCVLSLTPEPTVSSCNGVCNARILCIAAVPGFSQPQGERHKFSLESNISISVEDTEKSISGLESSSSSSSSEEEGDVEGIGSVGGGVGGVVGEDCDHLQPTMWLGTEDGCIHVYNSSDNIRIKKNKVKIQHGSAVHAIIYLDNRVFVSLANGDVTVYNRDSNGVWNTSQPSTVSVGTAASPVSHMVPIAGKLWCTCHATVRVLNINSLCVEHQFNGGGESQRSISCLAVAGLGVWLSMQHSAVIRLYHATSYDSLAEVNIAPSVTKMLASCDDIIRQHKAACLRVTALLACQDLLWVGTSAGVILTMPLPHVTPNTAKLSSALQVTGVPHGHTGHVRFLTAVEGRPLRGERCSTKQSSSGVRVLVISGGDGYEDFRSASISEVAGREDSTNHLLLWQT